MSSAESNLFDVEPHEPRKNITGVRKRVGYVAGTLTLTAAGFGLTSCSAPSDLQPQVAHGQINCTFLHVNGKKIKAQPRRVEYDGGHTQTRYWAAETDAIDTMSIYPDTPAPTPSGRVSTALATHTWLAVNYSARNHTALYAAGSGDLPSNWASKGFGYKLVNPESQIYSVKGLNNIDVVTLTTSELTPHEVAVQCSDFNEYSDTTLTIEVPPQATVVPGRL